MANTKDSEGGGVLVIPNERWYPQSVTFVSPGETRKVRTKDGGTREKKIVYTFRRGEPRRVDSDADYEWLKNMDHYAGERGVIRLFREVQRRKRLTGDEASQKLLGSLRKVLAQEGIELDDLVDSAESVPVEPDESPIVEESDVEGE